MSQSNLYAIDLFVQSSKHVWTDLHYISDNPHLEDKSSGEGFIENQYYNYFIRTIQNLLKRIAVEFVGDMIKESFKLRRSLKVNMKCKY